MKRSVLDKDLEELANRVGRSVHEIQHALKLQSLGLGYRRFVMFRLLTPRIAKDSGRAPSHSTLSTRESLFISGLQLLLRLRNRRPVERGFGGVN
jgi:hypothetical protein